MGQAKLYGQKTSGIDINGIIKNYYVYAGNNVSAGDLVEYINGIASQTTETSTDTQLSSMSDSGSTISAVKLDDSRVFIAYGYSDSSYLYAMVVTIDGTSITMGTDTQLSTTTYTARTISIQLLPNGNIFIAHDSGYSNWYLYGMIASINGTTITTGTDNKLNANMTYTGFRISTQLLPNGNIFIAHSYGSKYYLYGMVVTISGTTITAGTDTSLSDNTNAGSRMSIVLLSDGNIFIAHGAYHSGSNYYLHGMIVTINGTSITHGTDTRLSDSNCIGNVISTQSLFNGNIFIAHSYGSSYYLYGMIVTINGTSITHGTDTALSLVNYTGYTISTQLLSNGTIFIAHRDSIDNAYLYGMIVSINGTSITHGTDTQLSTTTSTGGRISTQLLSNGTIFIAHSYGTKSYLYSQIFGIDEENNIPTNQIKVPTYEQQVRPTTSSKFDGVAKTSGAGGTSTAHNQQVSIYTKPQYELTEFTNNPAPTSWTMGGGMN